MPQSKADSDSFQFRTKADDAADAIWAYVRDRANSLDSGRHTARIRSILDRLTEDSQAIIATQAEQMLDLRKKLTESNREIRELREQRGISKATK